MRAVVQRVRWAEVVVEGGTVGRIDHGLLVYLGVAAGDEKPDAEKLADKIVKLRIFTDDEGKLNKDVRDVRGGVLAVPNFTLLADAAKGRRPAFGAAAPPQQAAPLYRDFVAALKDKVPAAAGSFGAHMIVTSAADGPVNIILSSRPAR